MILPKIVYNSTTLNFTYPPVQKPGTDELTPKRTDTITSGGAKQSICERIDTFRTVQLDYVPLADLSAWASFMTWALAGGVFTYYPDATVSGTHDDWTLEDTDWSPAYNWRGVSKFKFKMRKQVAP
jgi:hypothetical protein